MLIVDPSSRFLEKIEDAALFSGDFLDVSEICAVSNFLWLALFSLYRTCWLSASSVIHPNKIEEHDSVRFLDREEITQESIVSSEIPLHFSQIRFLLRFISIKLYSNSLKSVEWLRLSRQIALICSFIWNISCWNLPWIRLCWSYSD